MSSMASISSARQRLGMGEVEAQPVRRDQRALLRDVLAEHLAQRRVQQCVAEWLARSRRGARSTARRPRARLERAALDRAEVHEGRPPSSACRGRGTARPVATITPVVADLAAGLGVERRLVDDDRRLVAGLRRRPLAVPDQRQDLALGGLGLVAEERVAPVAPGVEPDVGRGLAGARPGLARLAFCRSIAASKPSVSTARPRARRASSVRSSGKP